MNPGILAVETPCESSSSAVSPTYRAVFENVLIRDVVVFEKSQEVFCITYFLD